MAEGAHAMIDTEREDPLTGFHFALDVMGVISGYFTEISGLGSETEIITHNVVNEKGVEVVMKVPGRLKWGDIELKRGITTNMDLWAWRAQVEDGKVSEARSNGTITMFNQMLEAVAKWDFNLGWPSKIDGPSLKADDNSVVLESITITHEGISRVAP